MSEDGWPYHREGSKSSDATKYCMFVFIYACVLHLIPDRLKIAVVKPLHKKGDKFNISNYRPISLLPTFSKISEKAMYSRLNQNLYTNNRLIPEQYTFRKGMSTEDVAFRLNDSVLKSLNQKLHVGGIFVIY